MSESTHVPDEQRGSSRLSRRAVLKRGSQGAAAMTAAFVLGLDPLPADAVAVSKAPAFPRPAPAAGKAFDFNEILERDRTRLRAQQAADVTKAVVRAFEPPKYRSVTCAECGFSEAEHTDDHPFREWIVISDPRTRVDAIVSEGVQLWKDFVEANPAVRDPMTQAGQELSHEGWLASHAPIPSDRYALLVLAADERVWTGDLGGAAPHSADEAVTCAIETLIDEQCYAYMAAIEPEGWGWAG